MTTSKIIEIVCEVGIWLVATKAIFGYHFPWETCSCCGNKYKHHKQKGEQGNETK